jgi:Uma2 family endonuclease
MSIAERSTPPLVDGEQLSRDEFLRRWEAMPHLKRAELLEGVVYMPSPQSRPHGRIEGRITTWLGVYAGSTPGCDMECEATWLMQKDVTQPDGALWILPEFGGKSTEEGKYGAGPAEFLVEASLSSKSRDLGPKQKVYQRIGVEEYLVLLVKEREVRWHRLVSGLYRILSPGEDGVTRSLVFPGLWLNAQALFAGDIAKMLATLHEGLDSKEHAEFVKRLARKKRPKGKR